MGNVFVGLFSVNMFIKKLLQDTLISSQLMTDNGSHDLRRIPVSLSPEKKFVLQNERNVEIPQVVCVTYGTSSFCYYVHAYTY